MFESAGIGWSDWDGGQIGGRPFWLNPEMLPSSKQMECPGCARPMPMMCQLYAPLTLREAGHSEAFHRMLYVFCCTQGRCLRSGAGVLALRCQLPKQNKYLPQRGDCKLAVASPGATSSDHASPVPPSQSPGAATEAAAAAPPEAAARPMSEEEEEAALRAMDPSAHPIHSADSAAASAAPASDSPDARKQYGHGRLCCLTGLPTGCKTSPVSIEALEASLGKEVSGELRRALGASHGGTGEGEQAMVSESVPLAGAALGDTLLQDVVRLLVARGLQGAPLLTPSPGGPHSAALGDGAGCAGRGAALMRQAAALCAGGSIRSLIPSGGVTSGSEAQSDALTAFRLPAVDPSVVATAGACFLPLDLVVEEEPGEQERLDGWRKRGGGGQTSGSAATAGGSGEVAVDTKDESGVAGLTQAELSAATGGSLAGDAHSRKMSMRAAAAPEQVLRYSRWNDEDVLWGSNPGAPPFEAVTPDGTPASDGSSFHPSCSLLSLASTGASSGASHDGATAPDAAGAAGSSSSASALPLSSSSSSRSYAPPCPRCGAPRRFEFQVMPQMLAHLLPEESSLVVATGSGGAVATGSGGEAPVGGGLGSAGSQSNAAGGEKGKMKGKVEGAAGSAAGSAGSSGRRMQLLEAAVKSRRLRDTIDFDCLAVFTCTRSCSVTSDGYTPEFVALQVTR